ncbi:TolC family outer membrane protein [Legionella israelensis]|uniref:Agglutination protein n=1 Tax=Legionella israelensis TaxID=454 RepID=A0A0W0WS40_9GAMM|nr:TolC family outer membrane protein [Legionella israelensis]KTD35145.1 agglutination protein [Legionella israelensis]QBS08699.1 agglutination protein [Legionella israelensis]SCY01067.1 outer membrane protein, adhesin transport system [Legionella israelensis DSM 19235]STX58370.1 agglutination protein [Legionella israelensis]
MKKKSLLVALLLVPASSMADTLCDAVQHGLISNPEVLLNTAKALSARQAVDRAKGAYWPTIDANAGFGKEQSRNPTTEALQGGGKRTLNRVESSVELKQNLFAGGGIAYELKRNEYLYQAQEWKVQGVADDLALDIVQKYLNVLLHEKLYGYAVRNLREHRSVFAMIRERGAAGISRVAEVDQAQARLALAEANKISAEADLREARITYAKVVGKWPSDLRWPKIPSSKHLPKTLSQSIEKGLDNHPTLKSAYADVKEAKSQYEVAKASFYPRFDFVLSASKNKNLDGLVGRNEDKMAMFRMTYNLFRGGSDEARVRETAYQVQEAYEVKNQSIIDLKESLRLSWNAWETSGLRIRPLRQHVSSSYKTRAAYEEQFKVGKRTLLDLLDSQNEYYRAQIEYARGQNEEIFSRYRILNGMGMLLCYLKMRLPLNVVNNDVFSSAQTHVLLNKSMNEIPYPDNSDHSLVLAHPVASMDKVKLTPAIVNKNATLPLQIKPKVWYVSTGNFNDKASADLLVNRLKKQGFPTFTCFYKGCHLVLVGPYEYRGQAGNSMERLKEIAHVPGRLVTFKGPVK